MSMLSLVCDYAIRGCVCTVLSVTVVIEVYVFVMLVEVHVC